MSNNSQISNVQLLVRYAGDDVERWQEILGRQVTHQRYRQGKIKAIRGAGDSIYVDFYQSTERLDKKIERNEFESNFFDIELPPHIEVFRDLQKLAQLEEQRKVEKELRRAERRTREEQYRAERRIREERRREEQEFREKQHQAAEQRRQEELQQQRVLEAESKREFAALKFKYMAQGYSDSSPSSLLYPVLLKLDLGEELCEADIQWLKQQRLFGTVATFYEKKFQKSGDLWDLIKASRYWRLGSQPMRALDLTSDLTTEDSRLMSAVLTTRGGALRDINALSEAEQCAVEALQHSPNEHYPYNLLGAIYFQSGQPEKGDEFFLKAQQLGAGEKAQESDMRNAMKNAGQEEKRVVAEYLLRKDPERYKWAKHYLSPSL